MTWSTVYGWGKCNFNWSINRLCSCVGVMMLTLACVSPASHFSWVYVGKHVKPQVLCRPDACVSIPCIPHSRFLPHQSEYEYRSDWAVAGPSLSSAAIDNAHAKQKLCKVMRLCGSLWAANRRNSRSKERCSMGNSIVGRSQKSMWRTGTFGEEGREVGGLLTMIWKPFLSRQQ